MKISKQFIFHIVFFIVASTALAMDMGHHIANRSYTIAELFLAGHLDDWQDDFAAAESACMRPAIEASINGDTQSAKALYFECARRGSTSAMYQLGLVLHKEKSKAASDWFWLAYLLHFQNTGTTMNLARGMLIEHGVKVPVLQEPDRGALLQITTNQQQLLAPTMQDQYAQMFAALQRMQQIMSGFAGMTQQILAATNISQDSIDQFRRWQRVEEEIKKWLSQSKRKLQKRAEVFIVLCSPVSQVTVDVARELEAKGNALGKLEIHYLSERLLIKITENHSISFGPLEAFIELRNIATKNLLKELYTKRTGGLFGLPNDLTEFDRRCDLLTAPKDLYDIAGVIFTEKTPHGLSAEQRYLKAEKLALRADTPDAHALICTMYTSKILGQDLSARERNLKAQAHNDKAAPDYRQRTLKLIFHVLLEEFDQAIHEGEDLLTTKAPEKGIIYAFTAIALVGLNKDHTALFDSDVFFRIYGYAKMAVTFGFQDAKTLLAACEKALPFYLKESNESDDDAETQEIVEDVVASTTSLEQRGEVLTKPVRLTKKERKLEKQKRRLERIVASVRQDMPNLDDAETKAYPITFVSGDVKAQFELMARKNQQKMEDLFQDIMQKPWGTDGSGQPEVLKNHGKYGGMISRHITGGDRLVYDFVDGKIIIYSCVGHYI